MKASGIVLLLIGFALVIGSLFYETSVQTDAGALGALPDKIVNLGRLQQQMMLFLGGWAVFFAGLILAIAGAFHELLLRWTRNGAPYTAPAVPAAAEPVATAPDGPHESYVRPAVSQEQLDRENKSERVIFVVGGFVILATLAVALLFNVAAITK